MTKLRFKPEVKEWARTQAALKGLMAMYADMDAMAEAAGVELTDDDRNAIADSLLESGATPDIAGLETHFVAHLTGEPVESEPEELPVMSPEGAIEHVRSLPDDEAEAFLNSLLPEELALLEETQNAQDEEFKNSLTAEELALIEEAQSGQVEHTQPEAQDMTHDRTRASELDLEDQVDAFEKQLGRKLLQRELLGIVERADLQVEIGQRVNVEEAFKRYHLDRGEEPLKLTDNKYSVERAKDLGALEDEERKAAEAEKTIPTAGGKEFPEDGTDRERSLWMVQRVKESAPGYEPPAKWSGEPMPVDGTPAEINKWMAAKVQSGGEPAEPVEEAA